MFLHRENVTQAVSQASETSSLKLKEMILPVILLRKEEVLRVDNPTTLILFVQLHCSQDHIWGRNSQFPANEELRGSSISIR